MPEKPLVTSELMTCLLISSLRQSWGNTLTIWSLIQLQLISRAMLLFWTVIVFLILDYTRCVLTVESVSSRSLGRIVEDTKKGKYQQGKFEKIVCYIGQSFYIFVFWGNKDCGRTAVDTLHHDDSSSQRKLVVFNAELMRGWSPLLSYRREKSSLPSNQASVTLLFIYLCDFDNSWSYSYKMGFKAMGYSAYYERTLLGLVLSVLVFFLLVLAVSLACVSGT